MATNTKEIIFATFLDLLEKMPFDKITVRDIVEACGINRNTFYYYYSDIYEMLEEIFKNEYLEIVSNHSSDLRWMIGFKKLLDTAYSNPKIINNICASRSYEYLETYLFKSCRTIFSEFVKELANSKPIDEKALEFISSFYEYAIIGTLSEWFRTGMREKPEELLKQFSVVFSGITTVIKMAGKASQ